MQDKLNKLNQAFQKAKYEPTEDLASSIWRTIVIRNNNKAKIKMWAFSSIGVLSFAGLIPAFKILFTDLTQSGFYDYFSLIFSDGGSILSFWKEFVFSLAESLPVLSILLSLSLVFVFFLSLRYTIKQVNQMSLSF